MGGVLARTLELDTYLPPVVVVSLGLLGNDDSPEPQVSSDVQSPQALLVPESHTDGLQSLPLTANKDSSVASAPGSRPLRAWDTGIKCPGVLGVRHEMSPTPSSKEGSLSSEFTGCAVCAVQTCGGT